MAVSRKERQCVFHFFWWVYGGLPCDITAVISNHEDLREAVEGFKVPFHVVKVTKDNKVDAEAQVQALLKGNVLLFCAVLCEAAYAVIGKKLTNTLSPKRISALINLWGFVLMTPFGLYMAWQFSFASVANQMWLLLIFYALAASVWTVWLWMTGLKIIPSSQAGVFTVFLPVSAAVVGVLVLGESINTWQFIALCIALLGVIIATLPQREKRTKLNN